MVRHLYNKEGEVWLVLLAMPLLHIIRTLITSSSLPLSEGSVCEVARDCPQRELSYQGDGAIHTDVIRINFPQIYHAGVNCFGKQLI